MLHYVEQVLTNPKASAVTVAATVTSGLAQTSMFTTAATITGIILSWTMIVMHLKKIRREDKEHQLIMRKIDLEIEELIARKAAP
jgi:positive regulator of sigma E activity